MNAERSRDEFSIGEADRPADRRGDAICDLNANWRQGPSGPLEVVDRWPGPRSDQSVAKGGHRLDQLTNLRIQ